MENQIKLSVCIPVYNCEEFIGEAIKSVLDQNIRDMELLVVDNCSTDRTIEVINSFSDERIRLVQNETNIGMLGNWNKVVELARGSYIKVLPADDFLYPGSLEKQVSILENDKQKKIALVCGRKKIIDDKGRVLFTRGYSRIPVEVDGRAAINAGVRSGGNIFGEPGVVMFRKEILKHTGPFVADIFYVLDLSMWYKMLLHGNLYSLPDVICAFRISGVSESIKQINTQKRDVNMLSRKVYEDKKYGVTPMSYYRGLLSSYIASLGRKMLYKIVIR